MNINLIIQARMSSTRLPGKMLMLMDGEPMLWYSILEMRKCRTVDKVIVATSNMPDDDPIADFCRTAGVICFRGQLDDVADRFGACIDRYPCDAFVRVCGDSPLLPHETVDELAKIYRDGDYDLVTNIKCPCTPAGMHAEVVNSYSFETALTWDMTPDQREHVTKIFYDSPRRFDIYWHKKELPHLAVDTEEDFRRVEEYIRCSA